MPLAMPPDPSRGGVLLDAAIALAILAGLAAVSVPLTDHLRGRAKRADEERVLGDIRAAVAARFEAQAAIGDPGYPARLDAAPAGPASPDHPLFAFVLPTRPVIDGWVKLGEHAYEGPTGRRYAYAPPVGTFSVASGELATRPSPAPQRVERTGSTISVRQRLESGSKPGSVQ